MTTDLTPAEVAAALKLCEQATEGPWFAHEETGKICRGDPSDDRDNYPVDLWEDKLFQAAARTLLPRALATIVSLREENERLKAAAKGMLDLEARRMYEHDMSHDAKIRPCPCPGCKGLRAALENR